MIPEIFLDQSLSEEDKLWIKKLEIKVEEIIKLLLINGENISTYHFDFHELLMQIDLDSTQLNKEGTLMYALWVTLLTVLKKHILVTQMKYQTLESFLEVYYDMFELQHESDADIRKLWHTANWMNYLFTMVTAKKNKGLAMIVIPKLLEGWHVKYITGSGQKKATSHRVHIFEYEGNVKANHRGGKKKLSSEDEDSLNEDDTKKSLIKQKKLKKDTLKSLQSNDINHYDFKPPNKKTKKSYPEDNDINNINDYPTTFSAWQEATENYGLGLLALSRSNSHTNVKVEQLDSIEFQRDYSWADFPMVSTAPLTLSNIEDSYTSVGGSIGLDSSIPLTRVFSLNNDIDNKSIRNTNEKEYFSSKELPRLPSAPFRESSECWAEVPITPSSAPTIRTLGRTSIASNIVKEYIKENNNNSNSIFPISELPRLPSAPFRMSSTCWTEIPIIPGVPPTKDYDSWRANMIIPHNKHSSTAATTNTNNNNTANNNITTTQYADKVTKIMVSETTTAHEIESDQIAHEELSQIEIKDINTMDNTNLIRNEPILNNDVSVITSDALLSLFNGYHQ